MMVWGEVTTKHKDITEIVVRMAEVENDGAVGQGMMITLSEMLMGVE